jgi:hypothetical protein
MLTPINGDDESRYYVIDLDLAVRGWASLGVWSRELNCDASIKQEPTLAEKKDGVMRRFFVLLGIGLGILLVQPIASSAQTPDGVIELSGGSVAAGIGFTWGSGTLIFQGKRYPLKVSGLQIASVGIHEYTAAGSVEGLKTPQDINGVYTAIGAGLTLGGGESIAAMRNQKGVVIHLTATSAGLSISLAAGGMKIMLAE